MENEMINACIDIPDDRDYGYEEICWNNDLPEDFIIDDKNDYQNQWLEEITKYMCVFFSSTHWLNILNELEWVWEKDIKWKDIWLIANDKWLLDLEKWALIKNWPSLLKWLWHIKGYFLVNENNIKQAIYDWHPIVVWSRSLKWWYPCIAEQRNWHAVLIIWWNKEWYIIKNSYWKERFNKWLNLLPYNLFDKLYQSKFALIDTENPILQYKKQIMDNIDLEWAKKLFEKWLWNWKNPRTNMSRQEVMQVLFRVLEKLEKWEKIL